MPILALPIARATLLARPPDPFGPFRFPGILPAPLPSVYTEGGAKGSLTLVQADGQFSTSGGKVSFPAQATPVWGDLGFYDVTGKGRKVGRTLLMTLNQSSVGIDGAGWAWKEVANVDLAGTGGNRWGLIFSVGGNLRVLGGTLASWLIGSYSAGTTYHCAAVLRSTGVFLLITGGVFTDWTLVWVASDGTATTLYAVFGSYQGAGTLDDIRIVDVPSPFNSDYGIVTQRLAGARSAGDTFSHTANCLLEFTDTTIPSASTLDFRFRQQDATNYWQVTVDSTGALTLNEVVAGTPTSRGSAAAAVANGNRVVVVADGATIKVYSQDVLKITYSSASNFATATSGVLSALGTSGAVSDLVTWPRVVSLPAWVSNG